MDYKAYLSSLFYLTEAVKYLSPEQKVIARAQIINICRQAFVDTNVFGFKVYEFFFERFPEETVFVKNYLNKSKGIFLFRADELNHPNFLPRIFNGHPTNEGDCSIRVPMDLVNGPVIINADFNIMQNDEDGYDSSWYLKIQFENYKNYNEADIRLLMDRIGDFFPNR